MISATIITLNEEKNIKRALESLKDLVNEVIVVDCGSKDKTTEWAEKFGAKVFFRKFDNFANQKNFAAAKAIGEWILSVDADEIIPKDLAEEIKQAIKQDGVSGFLIGRRNFILGGEIKHSRWSPDSHIWLWKKDRGKWVGDVHEEVIISGKVGIFKNSKIHYSHKTVSEFIEANNKYSGLEAKSLYKNGIHVPFSKMIWQSVFEFFIRFIYKRGFLDGWRGFCLAYLMSVYKLTVWIKLWELNRKDKS